MHEKALQGTITMQTGSGGRFNRHYNHTLYELQMTSSPLQAYLPALLFG